MVWEFTLRGFFFQAEDGIRDLVRSRGLGDVYKRQDQDFLHLAALQQGEQQRRLQLLRHRVERLGDADGRLGLPLEVDQHLSLIHI